MSKRVMASPVLMDAPAPPRGLVDRPRLAALLEKGVSGPLTLVRAPAGSGKTALVASWVRARGTLWPAAWVTVCVRHNEPARLWTDIAAALLRSIASHGRSGRQHPGRTPSWRGLPRRESPGRPVGGDHSAFMGQVASTLVGLPAPAILVVDDVHLLTDDEAWEVLARMLSDLAPALRLVLSGRAEPRIPLGRLRVARELTEIRAGDLSFTPGEAAEFLGRRGLALRSAQVEDLLERTEGWAAGLSLAEQYIRAGDAMVDPVARFDGDVPSVVAYFRDEVLAGQPAVVRDFLLRTSVAERICVELADAITGSPDSARTLSRLAAEDLFIDAGGPDGRWYRAHRMLRQFLRHEARLELPTELTALHLRASRWCAEHDAPIEAMRHAVIVRAWPSAARTMVDIAAPEVSGPEREALRGLVAQLPDAASGGDPEIAAALALVRADDSDVDGALRFAALAQARVAERPELRRPPLDALLHLVAIIVSRHRGDHAALARGTELLLALLDGATPGDIPAAARLRSMAQVQAGVAELWRGAFASAEPLLEAGGRTAQHHGLDLASADALEHHALLLAMQGRLAAAHDLAIAALARASVTGGRGSGRVARAHLALGLVHWRRGEPADAARHLDRAAPATGSYLADEVTSDPTVALAAGVLWARLSQSKGDVATARTHIACAVLRRQAWEPPRVLRSWLAVAEAEQYLLEDRPDSALAVLDGITETAALDPVTASERVTAARVLLARDAPARARAILAPLHSPRAAVGIDTRIEAWLLDALAADRLALEGAVCIGLSEALAAAAPDEIRQPFLAVGAPLAELLDRHSDLVGAHGTFASRLSTGGVVGRAGATAEPAETISERESVVLRYLPTLLTAREIAAELYVSPNTVKTQLKSIYRKLDVRTRREAVDRARRLGLL